HGAFQSLSADEKRLLMLSIPILRLADNLDRSHEQRVEAVECKLRDGEVLLHLRSSVDIDLETLAAKRASEIFRQIYLRNRAISKTKSVPVRTRTMGAPLLSEGGGRTIRHMGGSDS